MLIVCLLGNLKYGLTLPPEAHVYFGPLRKQENFIAPTLHLHCVLQWFISADLRNDSNNSVTCLKSYTVFQ